MKSHQEPMTEHESKAVAQMRDACKAIESAMNKAMHGNYKDAIEGAQGARDRLYHADIELRRARVASLRKRGSHAS